MQITPIPDRLAPWPTAAASLAVGLVQSPAWMIAARAVQGVGAAFA
jgi:hypothetical protein